jgi:hypothetical protein
MDGIQGLGTQLYLGAASKIVAVGMIWRYTDVTIVLYTSANGACTIQLLRKEVAAFRSLNEVQ